MSNAKEKLEALINLHREGNFEELHNAWSQLEATGAINVVQETDVPDLDEFYEDHGGSFYTTHTLYISGEIVHGWYMEWRGFFTINSEGLKEWSELVNEYADDCGKEFGFEVNGDMYLFLDQVGVYQKYVYPEVP